MFKDESGSLSPAPGSKAAPLEQRAALDQTVACQRRVAPN
jgi:hypothetical protein